MDGEFEVDGEDGEEDRENAGKENGKSGIVDAKAEFECSIPGCLKVW